MKQMMVISLVMLLGLFIIFTWEGSIFQEVAHSVLTPILVPLIEYNRYIGMLSIILVLNLFITIIQKLTIDKETMKEVKKEQKDLREEMKKYKDHPEKLMELNKKSLELMGKSFPLTTRPLIFTMLPLLLLFSWFRDLFGEAGLFEGMKFLGMSWFWFYLIFSIIFGLILRKVFDVM